MKRLRFLPLCAVAMTVTACDGDGFRTVAADISVPSEVDFGQVLVDDRVRLELFLENFGGAPGTVEFADPGAPFSLPSAVVVQPGTTTVVVVQAYPREPNSIRTVVDVTVDGEVGQMALLLTAVDEPPCDDDNQCTSEVFDRDLGACVFTRREGSCDDNSACTTNDSCIAGVCGGETISCDDEVACTVNACDAVLGCVFTTSDDRCDDGDPCSDDVCDLERGCSAAPSSDGTRCDEGVVCEVAGICVDGICTAVPIPEGSPCENGDLCSGPMSCADGVCVVDNEEISGSSHVVSTERRFLPPAWIEPDPDSKSAEQAVFAADHLYVVAKGALTVVEVWPHGFEVIRRLPEPVRSVFKLDATTIGTLSDAGTVRILGLETPTLPNLIRTFELGGAAKDIFVSDAGGVGFCRRDGDSWAWDYLENPRVTSAEFRSTFFFCEYSNYMVVVGDQIVVSSPSFLGSTQRVFDFYGSLLLEQDGGYEGASQSQNGFRVGNRVVYQDGVGASPGLFVVDATTLDYTRVPLPSDLHTILGANQNLLYGVNSQSQLLTFDADDGFAPAFPPFQLPVHDEATRLAASHDMMLVLGEHVFKPHSLSLWTLNLAANGEVVDRGRDGFSNSVSAFHVGADETLTVFGAGSVTRGDVASLRAVPIGQNLEDAPPANPLSRRSSTVYQDEILLAIDDGRLAGALTIPRVPATGRCVYCGSELEWPGPTMTVAEFSPGGHGQHRSLNFINLGFSNVGSSVQGNRLVTHERDNGQLRLFDLTPAAVFERPPQITLINLGGGSRSLPHVEAHAGELVTVVNNEARLMWFGTDPPTTVVQDSEIFEADIAAGRSHRYASAYASSEVWAHLLSGGAIGGVLASNPILTVIARDPENPILSSAPVRVEIPSNTSALESEAGYRARILGVEDGLLYLSHVRIQGAQHLSEVLVYAVDAVEIGPLEAIPLASEAVGMVTLADGDRLIGREDGFTFLSPLCNE